LVLRIGHGASSHSNHISIDTIEVNLQVSIDTCEFLRYSVSTEKDARSREMPSLAANDASLARGISAIRPLPDPALGELWDSIILDQVIKKRLLSQAVLNFSMRPKVARSIVPLHGVILLVGPPGTGKTSLAKGLAHRTAVSFKNGSFRLLEVEPHELTSSAMGKTQRAVTELFAQSIAEAALDGPTIVLLDEVETLAVDRSKLSMEANPIDVHRATDAVLVQLDALAEKNSNLLFIATSNFPEAIDRAFTSRCDYIVNIPLPGADAVKQILRDCLEGLARTYPEITRLLSAKGFHACAKAFEGLDGRTIRKTVANACAASPETAMAPGKLTLDDLRQAATEAKTARGEKPNRSVP
jgi:AAA+ superfamily predicted ATPase